MWCWDSGRDLAGKITSTLLAYGLDLSNFQRQAYDGAGNMACSVNGTATLITADYPLALPQPCCCEFATSHPFSSVGKSISILCCSPQMTQALGTLSQHQMFTSWRTIVILGGFREFIDALEIFAPFTQSIVACMESICDDGPHLWSLDALLMPVACCLLSTWLTSSPLWSSLCLSQIFPGLDIQPSSGN